MNDTRNVTDEFKGVPHASIFESLEARGVALEIAIENLQRDFNMGSIVRSANAFGVRHVHIVGSRQWNKRGAMMTDKYLHIHYHASIPEFLTKVSDRTVIAIDNVKDSIPIEKVKFPERTVLVFGAEGPGVSDQLVSLSNQTVAITQRGSTRSLNVGAAAAIAMYEWCRQHTA